MEAVRSIPIVLNLPTGRVAKQVFFRDGERLFDAIARTFNLEYREESLGYRITGVNGFRSLDYHFFLIGSDGKRGIPYVIDPQTGKRVYIDLPNIEGNETLSLFTLELTLETSRRDFKNTLNERILDKFTKFDIDCFEGACYNANEAVRKAYDFLRETSPTERMANHALLQLWMRSRMTLENLRSHSISSLVPQALYLAPLMLMPAFSGELSSKPEQPKPLRPFEVIQEGLMESQVQPTMLHFDAPAKGPFDEGAFGYPSFGAGSDYSDNSEQGKKGKEEDEEGFGKGGKGKSYSNDSPSQDFRGGSYKAKATPAKVQMATPPIPLNQLTHLDAVLFDLDGVMVNSEKAHMDTFNQVLAEFGVKIPAAYWAKNYTGVGSLSIMKDIAAKHSLPYPPEELVKIRAAAYQQHIEQKGLPSMPGLVEAVRLLENKRIKVIVASSGARSHIKASLDSLGLSHLKFVGHEDVKQWKPNPDLFLLAAQKLGVAPEHCLVFEDSFAGVEAAARAKMACIALTSTVTKKQLAGRASLIVNGFKSPGLIKLLTRLSARATPASARRR